MKHIKKIEKKFQAQAVQTVNAMLNYINKAGPEILALLEGQTIGTSTGRPPKKIHEKIQAITNAAPCRSYVNYSQYGQGVFAGCSVWLKTDCNFKDGETGCRYAGQDVYLMDTKEGRLQRGPEQAALHVFPLYTVPDIERLQNEFEAAQEALRLAESAAQDTVFNLRHFCRP